MRECCDVQMKMCFKQILVLHVVALMLLFQVVILYGLTSSFTKYYFLLHKKVNIINQLQPYKLNTITTIIPIIFNILTFKYTNSVVPDPKGSSLCPQEPVTNPSPEPGESTPNLPKQSLYNPL
jgi:hypothetical protein